MSCVVCVAMRRLTLGWLTFIVLFASGSARAAPLFRFRANPGAPTHAIARAIRATARAFRRSALPRLNASSLLRATRRLFEFEPSIKAKRPLATDALEAIDPRLAALTKTLVEADGRAKKLDQAAPKRVRATNRRDPSEGAKYQKSVGSYTPLSKKQFAASLRDKGVPRAIAKRLVLVDVEHRGFDGKTYKGQIAVHKELQRSIARVFRRILTETDFPIRSVIPVSDRRFAWSDASSVAQNNCSGFNFRLVSGSHEVSDHAFGTAVDINPELNPWVKAGTKNRNYNPAAKGTLHRFSKVVKIFKEEGWKWGGDWKNSKDWQHFYRADIPERDFGKREVPE